MRKKTLKVSVIVPAYNSENTIQDCLSTLFNQTVAKQIYEIIVIDDGSSDDTGSILKKLITPDNFTYIQHSFNKGLAAARNTGIKKSSGTILIFLDSDMEVENNFIEKHIDMHNDDNIKGVVSAIKPTKNMKYDKYQRYIYEGKRGARGFGPDKPIPFHTLIFGLTSMKREVIKSCGLFDDGITRYGGEDTEYAYRVCKKYPKGFYYAPNITVSHNHYRSIDSVLQLVQDFGRDVVPYIVNKHPEIAHIYGYDYYPGNIKMPGIFKNFLKIFAGMILKQQCTQSMIRQVYKITPFPLSNGLVRVLMASSLLRGISKS